jgi:hypothetical protein
MNRTDPNRLQSAVVCHSLLTDSVRFGSGLEPRTVGSSCCRFGSEPNRNGTEPRNGNRSVDTDGQAPSGQGIALLRVGNRFLAVDPTVGIFSIFCVCGKVSKSLNPNLRKSRAQHFSYNTQYGIYSAGLGFVE